MIFPEYTYLLPSPYPEFFQIYQANSSESSILMPPSSRNSSPPAVEGEVKVNQSCITLCNPMDYSPILQARILGWVAIPFSRGSSQPNPGIEPRSPAWQADSLPAEPPGKPGSFQPSYFLLNISPQRDLLWLLYLQWKWKVKSLSRVRLFVTPWTVAHQAPPSMGFSRQEHWSGLPFPHSKWNKSEKDRYHLISLVWRT